MKKNIVLADCVTDEVASLLNGLNKETDLNFECKSIIANWGSRGIFNVIKRYLMYFYITFLYFLKRDQYDYILGWQQFYALVFCFWCRIFRTKKKNKVVVINFTYKQKSGFSGRIYKWFMKTCLSGDYINFIHVPSQNYANQCSRDFNIPLSKFIVTTFGINDMYGQWKDSEKPEKIKSTDYVLAIGRSNRDYNFLLDSWQGINETLVIISDTFKPKVLPDNVLLIDDITGDGQYPFIINSKAVILPIDDGRICSGDTVLLTSMSFKKIIIVTKPSTLSEMYIKDGENGLLITKDKSSVHKVISDIFYTDKYNYIGENARNSFLTNFSREKMGRVIGQAIIG